jgi:short-subunit dehydrogenase
MTFSNQIVLITGCSSGIGRELARHFKKQNAIVYATARKLASIDDLKADGINTFKLDVTDQTNVIELVEHIRNEQGHLDILVNNAGYNAMGPILDIDLEEVRKQFETNFFAPLNLIQRIVLMMIDRKKGLIVNIGSVSGVLATPFVGPYGASKAALHVLSDALRVELEPFNIKVITVQPGAVQSNISKNAHKVLSATLKKDSVYENIFDAIRERADASQQDPSPAGEFAEQLLKHLGNNPKPVLRIGKMSKSLPMMKRWIPPSMLDKTMLKKFKLNQLA